MVKKKKARKKAKTAKEKEIEYVLPLGNGWMVKNSTRSKFTLISDNKREAVSVARSIAKRKLIELIIYNKAWKVEEKVNYAI